MCLMGKSSSGKDTIFKKLLEQNSVSLKTLVPYTTRPIRSGEQNGVEYFFTDEEGYLNLSEQGAIMEERAYNTCRGLWRYFTVADENIALDTNSYLVIGTLESYEQLRKFYGEDKVLPVMIELEDGVRLQRALDREKVQDDPQYREMCRRFLADAEDFSEEKMQRAGIERTFYNGQLSECVDEIIGYLRENLGEG